MPKNIVLMTFQAIVNPPQLITIHTTKNSSEILLCFFVLAKLKKIGSRFVFYEKFMNQQVLSAD